MQNMQGNPQQMQGAVHKGVMPPQGYSPQGIPMASGQGNPQYSMQGYPMKQQMMQQQQQSMATSNMMMHGNMPNQNKPPTAILTNQNKVVVANQKPSQPGMSNQRMVTGDQNGNKESAGGKTSNMAATVTTTTESTIIPEQLECSNLANTKEKTPMCLLNELARYNKISHQYMLVDEEGPAHQKLFHVKLKLGEEEYSASGQSIKKAQHAVASLALEKTSFPKPPPKPQRETGQGLNSIMPTVELNAVAMRRGEIATYKPIEPRHSQYYQPPNFDFRGMYNQRYRYPRPTRSAYVSLKVGQREFIGEGPTHQAARHTAATKALRILKNLPPPNPPIKPEGEAATETKEKEPTSPEDELKSEISLVHEIGLKRNMAVNFEVIKESGPPHIKVFVTRCTVGDKVTEGEGNSKKYSKKRAAELMLEELKKLPALPSMQMPPRSRPQNNKKKNRNLIKLIPQIQKGDQSYGVSINPISRLIQITQAQKKKEPIFTLVGDHGVYHRREFVMQVQVDEEKCTGVGHNKKLAKRNAAEAMLHHLGFSQTPPQPSKSAIKSNGGTPEGSGTDKKVTFVDNGAENGGGVTNVKTGRQLVPGLLLIPDSSRHPTQQQQPVNYGQGSTPSDESSLGLGRPIATSQTSIRPEQRLRELALIHKFDIKFDDFAGQNNKNEHLSRLTLGLNPPQVLHGSGPSIEGSHDHAALAALQLLTKYGWGLPDASGDGPHVQSDRVTYGANRKAGMSRVVKTDLVN
ncbi:hypothetical protein SNE40_006053 [Patella caerulea]|uniref:DRBM domain-containing protein n=1 Tax=Patella caerulea TaxID=87958 RepID=A0AAN8PVL1_PATCE